MSGCVVVSCHQKKNHPQTYFPTLKPFVSAINPKCIIPIHTSNADKYRELFNHPILHLDDGETIAIP